MSKQYGLIIPNKNKKPLVQNPVSRPSIFDDDSDSDSTSVKPTGQTKSRKQDKLNQNKALEEDPTVFQYDELYDEMDQKRKESKLARKDLDRKPKYISKLLAAAERRKKENERRVERQVQKEREAEGEEFKDKESFVTSAYKKKLEEMKLLEEQEKREEYLESIGDVTKQGNLDGFYRHLYDQKVNFESNMEESEVKEEPKSVSEPEETKESEVKEEPKSESEPEERKESDHKVKSKKQMKNRIYRSRKESAMEVDDEEQVEVKKEHLPSNLDADSDFSIDSSDSEGDKIKEEPKEEIKLPEKGNVLSDNAALAKPKEDIGKVEVKEEEKVEPVKEKKPKIDIWKKRTVGVIFDEAVKRYFERRALKEAAG